MTDVQPGDDPFAGDDAAYVLGALSPAETAAFEAHLQGCVACRVRVDAVADMPALLGLLRESDVQELASGVAVAGPPEPGPSLASLRARRRLPLGWVAAAVAAAAAAVVALLFVTGGVGAGSRPSGSHKPSVVLAAQPMRPVRDAPLTATATLVARRWGTQIRLHCEHHDLPAGENSPDGYHDWYRLVVHSRTGAVDYAGSWTVADRRPTDFVSGTWLRPGQIDRVDITTSDGTELLQLRL